MNIIIFLFIIIIHFLCRRSRHPSSTAGDQSGESVVRVEAKKVTAKAAVTFNEDSPETTPTPLLTAQGRCLSYLVFVRDSGLCGTVLETYIFFVRIV